MVMLFDRFNLPRNIYEILFSTEQQAIVAKLLIKEFKENNNELGRTLMSVFATKLHGGEIEIITQESITENIQLPPKRIKISYNKRQFYDRILTPMRSMGLIEYDMYKKAYSLSDNFNKVLGDIGKMWLTELKKPI